MKKILSTVFSLLALLIMSTGTVFAAPLADGYLTLREVRNDSAGSVIFIFDVVGEFSNSDFKSSFVFLGDEKFPMSCTLEGSTLRCITSRATGGQNVTVNVGGFIFWTYVPGRSASTASSAPTQYCYDVYDVYYDESEGNFWQQFATHCQDSPANDGDVLEDFENPDFGYPSDYEFMPGNSECFDPVPADAYYGVCPS